MHRWLGLLLVALAGCSPAPKAPPQAKSSQAEAKILNFYASPASIHKGEDTMLCYGVEGAGWVKLDPPVESLSPAFSRCFQVKPETTTEYTLSIEGASQKVQVEVLPALPPPPEPDRLIRYFVAAPREASPGQQITLCYGVKDTKSITLTPSSQNYPPSEKLCVTETVQKTTTFRLTAIGNDGSMATRTVTVNVQ